MNLEDEPQITPTSGDPQIVPGYKWIRGVRNGLTIVDSRSYLFVWDIPYWPWWYFPRTHINGRIVDQHEPDGRSALPNGATRYDLICGEETLLGVARGNPDPRLRDLVTIEFDAMDHWFEEDVEVFVHPRSPFTRVDALGSSRHVVVSLDGIELADSHKPTVLFETGAPARFYLPMPDVNLDLLVSSSRQQSCPYKGDAAFFSARIGDRDVDEIAWTYRLPRPEVIEIAGQICFYNERVDIDVDGERQERPRSHFR
jgi:uncharacterized protein (DUF427 family)